MSRIIRALPAALGYRAGGAGGYDVAHEAADAAKVGLGRSGDEAMQATLPPSQRLIVALDVDTWAEAAQIVDSLDGIVTFYKVGLQLFLRQGLSVVERLVDRDKKVFLDLKIDDTPRTVGAAVRAVALDGVEFFTLQGNQDTAQAARAGRGARQTPKFLQVTFLSSWDSGDVARQLGLAPEASTAVTVDDAVLQRTRMILNAGCEGVIASGSSVRKTREAFGDEVIIVTPGIRPGDAGKDDHKRSLTPYDAIVSGADYLVVGRPIYRAADKVHAARSIVEEMERAALAVERDLPRTSSAASRAGP